MIVLVEDNAKNLHEIALDEHIVPKQKLSAYLVRDKLTGLFCKKTAVPDVWRYCLTFENGKAKLQEVTKEIRNSDFDDNYPQNSPNDKILLLLLESPHKKEYCFSNGVLTPKAPAQGKSLGDAGGAIIKYLPHLIDKINIFHAEYSVFIANPIPFHASLWHFLGETKINNKIRDHVWRQLWSIESLRTNFLDRLKLYHPDIILNCCTTNLTRYVNCLLCQNGYSDKTFVTEHPATRWNIYKENVKILSLQECFLVK